MKTHIQQTVAEIDARIHSLNELRQQIIVNFGAPVAPEPVIVRPLEGHHFFKATPAPVKGKPGRKPKAVVVKPDARLREGGILNNPTVIGAVRKLAEPFTAEVLASNGIVKDKTQASNFLFRAKKKGWLTVVAKGQFVRTKTFGDVPLTASASASATLAALKAETPE